MSAQNNTLWLQNYLLIIFSPTPPLTLDSVPSPIKAWQPAPETNAPGRFHVAQRNITKASHLCVTKGIYSSRVQTPRYWYVKIPEREGRKHPPELLLSCLLMNLKEQKGRSWISRLMVLMHSEKRILQSKHTHNSQTAPFPNVYSLLCLSSGGAELHKRHEGFSLPLYVYREAFFLSCLLTFQKTMHIPSTRDSL